MHCPGRHYPLLFAGAMCSGAVAWAEPPRLEGELTLEMQSEWGLKTDDPAEERGTTALDAEADLELQITRYLSVEGTVLLEPLRDAEPGHDTWFDDEGLFVEELLLKYERGPLEVVAGKIAPEYRGSRDQERGIWTEDYSTEYEIVEKIGVAAAYTLETMTLGTHALGVSAFSNDTTALAESIGTRTDSECVVEDDFSSSAVLLSGNGAGVMSTLYYQLGYRDIDACEAGEDDESGVLVTVGNVLVFSPSARVETDLLTEFGVVEDFEGSDEDRYYYSVSSVTTMDRHWSLSLGATRRVIKAGSGRDAKDHLFQLSAGYRSGNGMRVDAGWLHAEEFGLRVSVLGVLARYEFGF